MGNDKKAGGNLSLPTIPDFKEPEVEDGDTRIDRVTANTEVTVVMGYGPTIPSFSVPGLPDDVRIADNSPPSVDDMIADSLHAAVIPQPPTLSSILRTPAYAPTETSVAPLGSLADHMPPSLRDPADASLDGAAAVKGGGSRVAVILIILAALVAAVAIVLVFWPHLL
jgi:hypothetical protein